MDDFLKISQGLLTPLIAVITCYIAYQQWKTNQNKLNFDRYERRLEIYKEVVRFILIGVRDANYTNDEVGSFKPKVAEAHFLFGEEVTKYIDELQERAVNLLYWNGQYRDFTQPKPEDYNHDEIVKGMHEERLWISSQFEPARLLFKKYLDVSK